MKKAFKIYRELGFKCLPVKEDKRPQVSGTWKGGVTNENAYDSWGIGIATGDGLECWDFDNHFGDATKNLTEFIKEVEDLNEKYQFPIEKTQGGGYHLIFKCSEIDGNKKLAQRPKMQDGKKIPDTIIETRGEGGYFVTDPSPGYKWIRGDIRKVPEITPEERGRMLDAAKLQNTWFDIRREKEETDNRPGDIFNNSSEGISEAYECLMKAGWTDMGGKKLRRPGKDEGISGTFGYVADGIFYCFTSNGYPFEGNKAYTPFQVVSLLDYDGNFNEFAKELSRLYGLEKPKTKELGKYETKELQVDELERIFKKNWVNLHIEYEDPISAVEVRSPFSTESQRMLTLGNFSVIKGKQKAKKTFLTSLITSAACYGEWVEEFKGCLPEGKRQVIYIDTEQAQYDTAKVGQRILRLGGFKNLEVWCLRDLEYHERRQFIEYCLVRYQGTVGLLVIDGIADLVKSNNDEEDAKKVSGLLMRWSKDFDCHIMTVIHQNKADNFSTGHIGSEVEKKSEAVISVTKNEDNPSESTVHCDLIRGVSHFNDFTLSIDEEGLPRCYEIELKPKLKPYNEKLKDLEKNPPF